MRQTSERAWLVRACIVLVLALATGVLGMSYVERLCRHAGYYLVPVSDAVEQAPNRPRRAVVVVVDGLTLAHAERFESVRRLRAGGQCWRMTAGPITVSRPMYAVLSTGLEQDRTGCRNNADESPLAAESIWQVARRGGLRVTSHSGLSWWSDLFPEGFDATTIAPPSRRFVARGELADLTLLHPLYVDSAGHEAGANSALYAAAVERADLEVGALLDRLDLARDLVVFTADHGHRAHGGHGGPQPEVADVLTCFAGRGVARRSDPGRIAPTTLAPALAVLLGLPFPRHMRAGEDDLDNIFQIVDPAAFPEEYVLGRRAAVARFRAENRAELARYGAESWTTLYASELGARRFRLVFALGGIAALLAVVLRRRRVGWRGATGFLLWATAIVAATLGSYVAVRGSLDLSSINGRWRFLGASVTVSLAVALAAYLVHRLVFADRRRLVDDWFCLVLALAGLALIEPLVHGLRMGFPVPDPTVVFLPLLAPAIVSVHAAFSAALCVRESGALGSKP